MCINNMYVFQHAHTRTHTCTHKHTRAHTHARTHAHTRIRTHAHTRTHTEAQEHTLYIIYMRRDLRNRLGTARELEQIGGPRALGVACLSCFES